MGRGMGKVKFNPYKKGGGAETVLVMLKDGHIRLPPLQRKSGRGGGSDLSCLEGESQKVLDLYFLILYPPPPSL